MTRSIALAPNRLDSLARQAALPALILAAVIVTIVVPQFFPADGGPTGLDNSLDGHIHSSFDGHQWLYRLLVAPSNNYIVIPLQLGAAVWFGYRRRWWAAGFMIVGPELAILVNSFALKPFWDRHLHHYLAYPSGHTVQLVAVVTALALISESTRARVTIVVIMAVVLPAVLVGMVGMGYHHPTDVIGGTAAAIAMVTAAYLPWRWFAARQGERLGDTDEDLSRTPPLPR
ncbi:phosphatase PAP2 family protein [Nocardia sp. NPDC052001]|uniref:phosphatase PAP2 family protein n=1 Tax=Nocardia sp. NPDC052001 TaxID=3154853 RepID=UPI00342DC6A4